MGIDGLANRIGDMVTVRLEGGDVTGANMFAGVLDTVAVNWAREYVVTFQHGERVALLKGDTVAIAGERYTLR